jgi:hypothetical protein
LVSTTSRTVVIGLKHNRIVFGHRASSYYNLIPAYLIAMALHFDLVLCMNNAGRVRAVNCKPIIDKAVVHSLAGLCVICGAIRGTGTVTSLRT